MAPCESKESRGQTFQVTFLHRDVAGECKTSTVTYAVQVHRGPGKEEVIHRRYSEFEALRKGMISAFPSLPAMPPKSMFRKRLSASFMAVREERLKELIAEATRLDPSASTPALQQFLGLAGARGDEDNEGAHTSTPEAAERSRIPTSISSKSVGEDQLETLFVEAQAAIKRSTGLSNADLCKIYGLFKQATCGPVTGSRPGVFDVKGRAKYDAWASLESMDKDTAKQEYCTLVDRFSPGWRLDVSSPPAATTPRKKLTEDPVLDVDSASQASPKKMKSTPEKSRVARRVPTCFACCR